MKQKFSWFNDRKSEVTVKLDTHANVLGKVAPQCILHFELEVPEGHTVVIKEWDYNIVMFWVSKEAI